MCVCVLLLDLFWFFSSVLCGCCCYRLVLYSKSILICVWYETVTLRYIMYTIAQLWILTKSKWKLNVMSQCNSSINSIKMPKDSFVFINFGFFVQITNLTNSFYSYEKSFDQLSFLMKIMSRNYTISCLAKNIQNDKFNIYDFLFHKKHIFSTGF